MARRARRDGSLVRGAWAPDCLGLERAAAVGEGSVRHAAAAWKQSIAPGATHPNPRAGLAHTSACATCMSLVAPLDLGGRMACPRSRVRQRRVALLRVARHQRDCIVSTDTWHPHDYRCRHLCATGKTKKRRRRRRRRPRGGHAGCQGSSSACPSFLAAVDKRRPRRQVSSCMQRHTTPAHRTASASPTCPGVRATARHGARAFPVRMMRSTGGGGGRRAPSGARCLLLCG